MLIYKDNNNKTVDFKASNIYIYRSQHDLNY